MHTVEMQLPLSSSTTGFCASTKRSDSYGAGTRRSRPQRCCAAIIWMETVLEVLGILAFSAFSALRAYALSNRNRWFAAIVIFLALPPSVIFIIQWLFQHAKTLPSPFNCSASINISPAFTIR
ncbi:hypothetical protein GSI_04935 [Ganoderma sinense ZZ0214-1]|uniref:Uncharacterized protein n=1 Tax=Ganoderma sinense ZZ0214-1 TaxID=1077348 RepID=A0A2G8SGX5_9APHY|nr:hypothetical protein GSI_04935 [Ganoderma sinense ZZ0214-1]